MEKLDPLQQAAKPTKAPDLTAAQPKPDLIDRLGDTIERNHANPGQKIGAGHAAAMWRSGLKEVAQALVAFPDSIRPVEEPGLAGNPTNIEVVNAKDASMDAPKIEAPRPNPMSQWAARVASTQKEQGKEAEISR